MTGEARVSDSETGPLDGVTVLDASRVLVGPFCTMQLGDLGADVIKVERPGTGDQTRTWYPPSFGDQSAYFTSVNRNKRSIALDLGSESGRDVFRSLAAEADVLVENFRVGAMESWGLGYEDLATENPELVYCSLSGYGEWGPKRDVGAYDIVMQAEGGLMSITGEADGPPIRIGVALVDIGAGMYATQAILAALLYRELGDSGGQKVDVSLLDSEVAWLSYMASYYFASGDPPGRKGSKHPTIVPYQAFRTTDGYVVVAVPSEPIWADFCAAIGRPDLRADERFEDNAARVEHRDVLEPLLESRIEEFTTEEALDRLESHGVPCSTVRDIEEVFDSPQVQARGLEWTTTHPSAGQVRMPGSPMHFSHTGTSLDRHPPLLGEHTAEILAEAGYSEEEVRDLLEREVVA